MAKELGDKGKGKALEAATKSGAGFAWIREDGAVCFRDECVVLKPQDDGKLNLQVKPSRCGKETGRVILDYLLKTTGKGITIEIPSEAEES
jgi:hypothetical protein